MSGGITGLIRLMPDGYSGMTDGYSGMPDGYSGMTDGYSGVETRSVRDAATEKRLRRSHGVL
jgi:hypothetical protein